MPVVAAVERKVLRIAVNAACPARNPAIAVDRRTSSHAWMPFALPEE